MKFKHDRPTHPSVVKYKSQQNTPTLPVDDDPLIGKELSPKTIVQLQRTIGNQAVIQLLRGKITRDNTTPNKSTSVIQRADDEDSLLKKMSNSKHQKQLIVTMRFLQSLTSVWDGDGETNLKNPSDGANPPAERRDGPAKTKERKLNSDPPGGTGPDPDTDTPRNNRPRFTVNNPNKLPTKDDIWSHTVEGEKPKKKKTSKPFVFPENTSTDSEDGKKRRKRRRDGSKHKHVPRTQQIKEKVRKRKALEKMKNSKIGKKAFKSIPYLGPLTTFGETAYKELIEKPNQVEPDKIEPNAKPDLQQDEAMTAAIAKYIALEQKQASQYGRKLHKQIHPDYGWFTPLVETVMDTVGGELSTANLYLEAQNLAKERAARILHLLEKDGYTLSDEQSKSVNKQVRAMYIKQYKTATAK